MSQPVQKQHGDLDRQIQMLKKHAKKEGYAVSGVYADVASGLNDKRKGFWKMFADASRVFILI
ncbi:MAG: hypothetical protein GF364_14525 [Candidatus Lokiarchaeota archaeon]|nr:hypothetical protein [Candidatus Lokiarchaeota archaeon]